MKRFRTSYVRRPANPRCLSGWINGSTWSVVGSDVYDRSLVGTSIAGLVMSEFALANPSAWATRGRCRRERRLGCFH
jgi:hypothetical protein